MRVTASGGTDGANIVLFWPENLPGDADRMLQDDPIDLVEKLQSEGKLIWFPCDGDGSYTVAIFVGEEPTQQLREFCEAEEEYPELVVNGVGYFGGLEYIFKHDRELLDDYPHMCDEVEIPPGTYSGKVCRTNVPRSFQESWLLERCGTAAVRLWKLHGWIVGLSVVGVAATLISVFFLPWLAWFSVLGATAALISCGWLLSKTDAYRNRAQADDEFERAFPSYVVQLQ